MTLSEIELLPGESREQHMREHISADRKFSCVSLLSSAPAPATVCKQNALVFCVLVC